MTNNKLKNKIKTRTSKEMWVMSALSDAQEQINLGLPKDAQETINNAKRILMGKYKEVDDGFSIKILKGKRNL